MYVTDHQQKRIRLAQIIDRIFFEPGNARRCHKWVYRQYARHFLGVSYDTYLIYLHQPTDAAIPHHIVAMFENEKARLDELSRSRVAGRIRSAEPGKRAEAGFAASIANTEPVGSREDGSGGNSGNGGNGGNVDPVAAVRKKEPAEQY